MQAGVEEVGTDYYSKQQRKPMKNIILMCLCLMVFSCVNARSDFENVLLFQGTVNNIELNIKRVEVNGQFYPYRLKFGNVYFESLKRQKSIEKLPLNRKYYIEIFYLNHKDYTEKKNGFVTYIGKIKPFL